MSLHYNITDTNLIQQKADFKNITPQWDLNPEICVPLGGAITASVLCCNHFHGTLLEKLNPENLAIFPESLSVLYMAVRRLIMPDGKVSKDFFHGSMQNNSLVPKNVSIIFVVVDWSCG